MRLSHRPGPNSTFGFRFLQSRPERRLRCHTASDLELFPVDPLFAGVADEYDSPECRKMFGDSVTVRLQ